MSPAPSTPLANPSTQPLAPIPLIPGYYGQPTERPQWLRQIFDDTAPDYDRVERWLSLGSGKWYRRQALNRAGVAPGMRIADVGAGTGLLAREAVALIGPEGSLVAIDPSPGMLARAQEALKIETAVGRAESLPLPSSSFDMVTMGYALRHLEDLNPAFAEFSRVLKPGGRVCILEITRPARDLPAALLRSYMSLTAGIACLSPSTTPRTRELWRYYNETIDRCIPPERVLEALRLAGFADAKRHVTLGIFSEYTGTRA